MAVHEILLQNAAAGAAIREGHIAKLNQVIQSGRKMGMQSMDDALLRLVKDGVVEAEAAYMKANDKKMFKHLLKDKAG